MWRAFDGGEVEGLGRGRGGRAQEGTDEVGVDLFLGQGDGSLDQVLELAHVAGEVMGEEQGERLGTERRHRDPLPLAETFRESAHQVRDVLPAIA